MPVELITTEVEKTCSTCQEQYPADREFFFSDKRSADGLRSVCKAGGRGRARGPHRPRRGARTGFG